MMLRDRSGYFAGPGMLGGSFAAGRAGTASAEEGAPAEMPAGERTVVFYELTRKFVEATGAEASEEVRGVLSYTLAVGHHTGVLDCFEPRLAVAADVLSAIVASLPEGDARRKLAAVLAYGEVQIDKTAVDALLDACAAALEQFGYRGSAKAGIDVLDPSFGLHTRQVAFLTAFQALLVRTRDEEGVYLTGRLQ